MIYAAAEALLVRMIVILGGHIDKSSAWSIVFINKCNAYTYIRGSIRSQDRDGHGPGFTG